MDTHFIYGREEVLLKQAAEKVIKNKLSIGTAESCTGGRIASMITSLPEISDHFIGGIVSYSEEIKEKLLGVSASDIEKYGVVSQPVAEQMALGASRILASTCSLASTGFAGPDGGSPENPVGTVWIAVALQKKIYSQRFLFNGDRQEIVRQSSCQAFQMLLDMLA